MSNKVSDEGSLPKPPKEARTVSMVQLQDEEIGEAYGYTAANLIEAEDHFIKNSIRDEEGNRYPVCKTDTIVLARYGLGLTLYFSFLKKITICFFIMSLGAIIPIYSNTNSSYLAPEEKKSLFDTTTIAN